MKIFNTVVLSVGIGSVGFALGAPNGDRPDDRHAWAVHDENRPNPIEILAEEESPPSDAIVLFDGTEESVKRHWCDIKGNPTKWVVRDGAFYCVPSSGMAYVRDEIGDCQIHVEFRIPDPPGEGLGNSGVYVHGLYEIQVLHSYYNTDSYHPMPPWKHANYADGQLGAIYGQNPPIVNPARNVGKWQSFDIVFHAAVWEDGHLVRSATLTVFLNGVLIQDEWRLEGPTGYVRRPQHDGKRELATNRILALQDHGHPVAFRNIWARGIPFRRANMIHGGEFFDAAEAERVRVRLAGETLKNARASTNMANRLVWLWESYMYHEDVAVKMEIDDVTARYIAQIETWAVPLSEDHSLELSNMIGFVDMGVRCGMFTRDAPLARVMNSVRKRNLPRKRE